ncbi:uncharacterized protein LOC130630514 [Hydractinia symbiolongicarpus]|uniref:uncharacterized protein LOC130630514 n=1 Tax=Hydractinia symbiolongicarpus TaxID=13093 RepID=UPI00254D6712|nr:uncharacterized protein LOC130630514 [Hydractinia symbiolongicarpus]
MSALIGVLLDVSGSMEKSIGTDVREDGGAWARSIFQVLDDLIKHDVSQENKVFALAVGGRKYMETFDLLNTVRKHLERRKAYNNYFKIDIIEQCLHLLKEGGAPYVDKWTSISTIDEAVSLEDAELMLDELTYDCKFKERVALEYLPGPCRNKVASTARDKAAYAASTADSVLKTFPNAVSMVEGVLKRILTDFSLSIDEEKIGLIANKRDIREVVSQAREYLLKRDEHTIIGNSVITVHQAAEILHGCIENKESLTEGQINELMEVVEPFIYGNTPLITAMRQATQIFDFSPKYQQQKRVLFILSDGDPSDGVLSDVPMATLETLDVTVICCFITDMSIDEPKRLYSKEQENWCKEANFMFHVSSKVPTQLLPRTIFVKRGWNVDVDNNETRLFIQANHPDIIAEACDLARNVVCCQDALTDVLSSVSLDMYINQSQQNFGAQKQVGGTCYANATAAVLHLSMHRIIGRDGGYPEFDTLRDSIIATYGKNGASTAKVLEEVCPRYRLQFKEVDTVHALNSVTSKRPVLARFYLTSSEWEIFSKFYRENPRGILSKAVLDITQRPRNAKLQGHAVVLTSFNSECLRLMNSWGCNWADQGFFRVSNASVLQLYFIDVYWTLNDLKLSEIDAYDRYGAAVADVLTNNLKGLQTARYTCPLCGVSSLVSEFSGRLDKATCPNCTDEFQANQTCNILALNLYLTSLCY